MKWACGHVQDLVTDYDYGKDMSLAHGNWLMETLLQYWQKWQPSYFVRI